MPAIPRDDRPDSTWALLSEGYPFIMNRCRRFGSDLFTARLMFTPAICMSGPEAARVFYEPGRFTRNGALPTTALRALQDKGSVQTLDGDAHRRRKAMFMELMTPPAIARLQDLVAAEWAAAAERWHGAPNGVVLLAEARGVLCRAAGRWIGLPLTDAEADRRTAEIGAMIDGAASVGPRNWRALWLRRRTERWLRAVVAEVRAGRRAAEPDGALAVVAAYREPDGRPLDLPVAAVELLNVLRPIVAVARFIVFAALALHEHPHWRDRIRDGDGDGDSDATEWFVQEVRRLAPFFPMVGGRVREPFAWHGHDFAPGTWVLLDLFGTNRDPRAWEDPEAFRPERFRDRAISAYEMIPQGGGGFETGHRCPGEWITIALMKTSVRVLAAGLDYRVPDQDLSVDLTRMPAAPRSRFIIADVRRRLTV
ncbi:cytochrome P450 [Azospirillum halopraeferens]|uniref:cytochrome P450 n=1 Tax=Azospirillum halopraeferens TaxID=34010 RepID=UPI0004046261|nr:cytochrome P450 [Azospirillum halopraeferens]